MTGYEYEEKCAKLLKARGFTDVKVTPGSGDQGIDVLAKKGGKKYGVQCKYYEGTVGNKAVQEAFAGASFYDCAVAMIITNSKLTEPAKKLAVKLGVEVWEGIDAIYLQKNDEEYIKKEREKKKREQEQQRLRKEEQKRIAEEKKQEKIRSFQTWKLEYIAGLDSGDNSIPKFPKELDSIRNHILHNVMWEKAIAPTASFSALRLGEDELKMLILVCLWECKEGCSIQKISKELLKGDFEDSFVIGLLDELEGEGKISRSTQMLAGKESSAYSLEDRHITDESKTETLRILASFSDEEIENAVRKRSQQERYTYTLYHPELLEKAICAYIYSQPRRTIPCIDVKHLRACGISTSRILLAVGSLLEKKVLREVVKQQGEKYYEFTLDMDPSYWGDGLSSIVELSKGEVEARIKNNKEFRRASNIAMLVGVACFALAALYLLIGEGVALIICAVMASIAVIFIGTSFWFYSPIRRINDLNRKQRRKLMIIAVLILAVACGLFFPNRYHLGIKSNISNRQLSEPEDKTYLQYFQEIAEPYGITIDKVQGAKHLILFVYSDDFEELEDAEKLRFLSEFEELEGTRVQPKEIVDRSGYEHKLHVASVISQGNEYSATIDESYFDRIRFEGVSILRKNAREVYDERHIKAAGSTAVVADDSR